MKRILAPVAIAALVGVVAAGPASAEVEVTVRAQKEVVVMRPDGEKEIQRVEAERAVPGDEVIFTIAYRNGSEEAAENVKITNPVPEHMLCRNVETGDGSCEVTFSIDGGAHYDARENLRIVDAAGNVRPAEASDYTHIRWTFLEPLGPGQSGTVGFRAELQ